MSSYVVKRIFFGMILILIGILFLGSQLGFISINPGEIASTYWPVAMILFGISGLLGQAIHHKEKSGSYVWNFFVVALGVGFLARNLNFMDMSTGEYIKLLIPVFIILFGIRMMFGKEKPPKIKQDYSNKYEYNYDYEYTSSSEPAGFGTGQGPVMPEQQPINNYVPNSEPNPASNPKFNKFEFNDYKYSSTSDDRSGFIGDLYLGHDYWELKPMNISHFIGDTIIDLTKAQIPIGDTKLNISAFIGDVKVYIPNAMEVEVSVTSSSFLGDSTVFKRMESGFMRSLREESQDFSLADKKIRLQINLFIGDITVQRVG